jgi:murein DD-endopeptidase MepM/ murein hydrolase activator NlpD
MALCGFLLGGGAARPAGIATVPPVSGPPAAGTVSYRTPVTPLHVVRGFDPPATPFGPGHLGVDLATSAGQRVRAAADGEVSFAGSVAGRGLVVITHADGIRTEYEPVRPAVHRGQRVRRGATIGHVDGTHGSCAPGSCLHWGARRGDQYLDPLTLLARLGPVRLLPWSGAGVGARVGLAQPLDRDVRVQLGGRQARVAEKFLHRTQVGAAVEQVRRGGVA